MKKRKIIILIVLIVLGLLGLYFYPNRNINPTPPILPRSGEVKNSNPVNLTELSFLVNEKTNVYDFMSQLRRNGKINFKEKNYIGMGKFISTINGIRGNGEKNWIYYVNGKEAKIGVSNYKVNAGDIVSWKYEKYE